MSINSEIRLNFESGVVCVVLTKTKQMSAWSSGISSDIKISPANSRKIRSLPNIEPTQVLLEACTMAYDSGHSAIVDALISAENGETYENLSVDQLCILLRSRDQSIVFLKQMIDELQVSFAREFRRKLSSCITMDSDTPELSPSLPPPSDILTSRPTSLSVASPSAEVEPPQVKVEPGRAPASSLSLSTPSELTRSTFPPRLSYKGRHQSPERKEESSDSADWFDI